MELRGKKVVITGAANGIGRATARAFAQKGADLALSDIDEPRLEAAKAEMEQLGARVVTYRVDVASESEVTSMIERTIADLGDLDVVVNNAGVSVSGPAEITPIEDWRWIMDINVWAHVYSTRAALPYMKDKGSGHLVFVASAAGILGTPALSAYCMTKFAVAGLAESLAISLHGTGIGVSVVCPLWVQTDIAMSGRVSIDPDLAFDVDATKAMANEMLKGVGIAPEDAAAKIVDGVENGHYMILPHPEVLKYAQIKWHDPDRYIERAASALQAQREFFGEVRTSKTSG